MTVYYYPGCSLHSTAVEYDRSAWAVLTALGHEIKELPDWTCCGASSAHSLDHWLGLAIPARNLIRAAEVDPDPRTSILAPCSACYNRLARANRALQDPRFRDEIGDALGTSASHQVSVPDVISFIHGLVLASSPRRQLSGLKVACYYGCLLVRPFEISCEPYPEHPRRLDQVMAWTGAEPVAWSGRTECCGGNQGLIDGQPVTPLVRRIVDLARDAGANALVTACPLCQANLEMRQTRDRLPSFYFTELLALSLGLDASRGWNKHLIDPRPTLASCGLE